MHSHVFVSGLVHGLAELGRFGRHKDMHSHVFVSGLTHHSRRA